MGAATAAAAAAHGASDLGTAAARGDAPQSDRKCLSLGRGGGGRSRTGNRARGGGAHNTVACLPAHPPCSQTAYGSCSSRRSLAGWPSRLTIALPPQVRAAASPPHHHRLTEDSVASARLESYLDSIRAEAKASLAEEVSTQAQTAVIVVSAPPYLLALMCADVCCAGGRAEGTDIRRSQHCVARCIEQSRVGATSSAARRWTGARRSA